MKILLDGLIIPESPRWHEGRLWLCHWGAGEIISIGEDGGSRVEVKVPAQFPFCIDWLPDGRLLAVCGMERMVLRREHDGTLVTHAELGSELFYNEIAVDARGNSYVNSGAFDGTPGDIVLITPEGATRQVADNIAFGNGMVLTPNGETLIVAESYGTCLTAFDVGPDGSLSNRRIWADLNGDNPDGICLDETGAVWYASVPGKQCLRVREGGEVLDRIELDRGGFACWLGGSGSKKLYILAAEWHGLEGMESAPPSGQVLECSLT